MRLLAILTTAAGAGTAAGMALPVPVARGLHAVSSLVSARTSSLQTLINDILADIATIFPIDVAITDLSDLVTDGEALLADVLGVTTTDNGLDDSCADVTIVFARGTCETGNVGLLVGPPFFLALEAALGSDVSVEIQGVDYSATVEGYLEGGDPAGSQTMADDVTDALSKCPDTKLVMAGYSQGGQIVHNAAELLPSATMAEVAAVVIFGDPDDGEAVAGIDASKVLIICHDTDDICLNGDLILLSHLTYAENAEEAATFVVDTIE